MTSALAPMAAPRGGFAGAWGPAGGAPPVVPRVGGALQWAGLRFTFQRRVAPRGASHIVRRAGQLSRVRAVFLRGCAGLARPGEGERGDVVRNRRR